MLIAFTGTLSARSATGVTGNWVGTLDAGAAKLRVQFRISAGAGGGLTAKMDSLDQGASDIPVDTVTFKDGTVRMEVKVVQGVYEGTLDKDGAKITGKWQQGLAVLPLTLERSLSAVRGKERVAAGSAGAEAVAKRFVSLLAAEDFPKAAGCLDAAMKGALPGDKLKELWTNLVKEQGPFQRMGRTRTETVQGYRIVFVNCQFAKRAVALKVVLDQADKVTGLFFLPGEAAEEYKLPAYARTNLFREKEVVVGAGEWQLPGTLCLPAGKGPFPALVLVQGSGPHDRDESIGANKPFRDLAWGLASQGIAVLRYEKRTKQYAAKMAASLEGLTVNEETVADALAAVSLLRHTEGIDPGRVFVLGHSLGGTVAPRIGAHDSNIAGLIVLAGAARPLEDLMLEQTLYQASLAPEQSAEGKRHVEEVKRSIAAIKTLSNTNPPKGQIFGAPAGYWLDLKGYNPPEAAKGLKQPMLILQGEKDCQVNAKLDFERWRRALSGRNNVTFKSYPTLNHLFMEVDGKSTGAEYELAGHVAESVIADIATWVRATPR